MSFTTETQAELEQLPWFENYDVESVVTPIDVEVYERLLIQSKYNKRKRLKLVQGFWQGFDLHYEGKKFVTKTAPNLKIRVGTPEELWCKVMKEVEGRRYAGPFLREELPFRYFIQSPIGLVPKDKGRKTRLIFHLSYPKSGGSVNEGILYRYCKVKYMDFDEAIKKCLGEGVGCHVGKSDISMAFRNLPLNSKSWPFLVMKAKHPKSGVTYYYFDKCLSFGSSISCRLFQDFSDSVAHICKFRSNKSPVNYLDDFLFASLLKLWCNWQLQNFLDICGEIKFPVALDKTEWGTTLIVFLGLLIDTVQQVVCVSLDKVKKAKELIAHFLDSSNKSTTVHQTQKLCGFLNFLCKCMIPGRAFTIRIYSHIPATLLPHHHFHITNEMRLDLQVWDVFLNHPDIFCCPFMDFNKIQAEDVDFYTDASGSWSKGRIGAICGHS